MSGLPFMTLTELTLIFGYKDDNQTKKALNRGTLDIPTYKIRGRIVADTEVVQAWFEKKRSEGMAKLAGNS